MSANYEKRIAQIKKSMEQVIKEDEIISGAEVKMGIGDNALVIGDDYLTLMTKDPGVDFKVGADITKLSGGTIELGSKIGSVRYPNDKVINPQVEMRPPNGVNFYPFMITIPPGVASGIVRGIAGAILGILEIYRKEQANTNNLIE